MTIPGMNFKEEYAKALEEFMAAADAADEAASRKRKAFHHLLQLEKSLVRRETGIDRNFSVDSMPTFTVSFEEWLVFKKGREVK